MHTVTLNITPRRIPVTITKITNRFKLRNVNEIYDTVSKRIVAWAGSSQTAQRLVNLMNR